MSIFSSDLQEGHHTAVAIFFFFFFFLQMPERVCNGCGGIQFYVNGTVFGGVDCMGLLCMHCHNFFVMELDDYVKSFSIGKRAEDSKMFRRLRVQNGHVTDRYGNVIVGE
jgi:hypothetical protein